MSERQDDEEEEEEEEGHFWCYLHDCVVFTNALDYCVCNYSLHVLYFSPTILNLFLSL